MTSNFTRLVAGLISLPLLFSCSSKSRIEPLNTPSEALTSFITAMIEGDTEAMLDMTGHHDGSPLDDAEKDELRQQMNASEITSGVRDSVSIQSFEVVKEEEDGYYAVCTLKVIFIDGKENTEDGTLALGPDGYWRLPLFE